MCPHLSHDLISAAPTNKSSGTRVNYRVPNWCSSSSTKTATAMWKGRDEICCHHFFQRERDVHQMRWWNWDWNTPLSWNSSRFQASHGHLTYTKILRSDKFPKVLLFASWFQKFSRKRYWKRQLFFMSLQCHHPIACHHSALIWLPSWSENSRLLSNLPHSRGDKKETNDSREQPRVSRVVGG